MSAALDGGIILLYLAGVLALGLRISRSESRATLDQYLLGGHSTPWWAVLGSIIAAEITAATFLGVPGETFKSRSFVYCQLAFGMAAARVVVAKLFLKAYFDHRVQSIYELLAIRFGPMTKNAASFLFLSGRLLGTGVRVYIGAVVLAVAARYFFHSELSWTGDCLAIVAVLAFTVTYTALGGIRAVIYTDVVQAIFMIAGAAAAIYTLRDELGALGDFHIFVLGSGSFTEILKNPYTVYSAFIGMLFLTAGTHGTDQDMVQRMLAARNSRESRLSLILSGIADVPVTLAFAAIGILLWAHYQSHPDPSLPQAPNEIFAHYIVHELPPGVRGFVLSALLATVMGSTSAALNSLSTSFVKDWYLPYLAPRADEATKVAAAKKATLSFALLSGIIACAAAYEVRLHPLLTIVPVALSLLGFCYGAILGVFLLAVLTKNRGNDRVNVLAMAAGITAVGIAGHMGWIAWSWYALLGCAVTVFIAAPFKARPANH